MALARKTLNKRRMLILGAVLGAAAIAAAAIFLFPGNSPLSGGADAETQLLERQFLQVQGVEKSLLKNLEALLEDERYQELQQFGDLPVETGPLGRENPFSPL